MANEILRDSRGSKIGEIQVSGDKSILRDARGSKLGEYDPKSNTTRDSKGAIFGTGNLLAALLNVGSK